MTSFREKVYPVRKAKRNPNKKEKSKFSNWVYQVVKKIPKGEIISYKELAKKIGRPKAWRAVGNALSKNQNAQIPCHRVIKSDGTVGSYNRGQRKKIVLLKKEGAIQKSQILNPNDQTPYYKFF